MKNLISFEDRRFVLLKVILEDRKPIVDTWKELLFADTVLRKDGRYFFCQEIKDAEILEEWIESDSERWLKDHKKEPIKEPEQKETVL